MFKHILVPVDSSNMSMLAVDTALDMAAGTSARVTAVTVSPNYPTMITGDGYMIEPSSPAEWDLHCKRNAEGIRNKVEKHAKAKSATVSFVIAPMDLPYLGIIETAKNEHCDLIVMASHGRSGLTALLLGSETTKVLTHTKLPVLVCR